ncbi:BEN domain-containing protein 5-like [Ornithodoros turicata]|uniref:BEN domain-containing protein 5-like n=1 Tax=Ornithodoros turicata TaxID=34597 RepID=UPI003138BD37
MYAYVRYIENDVPAILPVSLIRNFHPKSCDDYDTTSVKKAFWESKSGQDKNYNARVLLLGESEKDLIVEMASRRMAIPDIIEGGSDAASNDAVDEVPLKEPRHQREKKKEAQTKQLEQILKKQNQEDSGSSDES